MEADVSLRWRAPRAGLGLQPVGSRAGTPEAKWPPGQGHGPALQQTGCLPKSPLNTAGLAHQKAEDPASQTRTRTLDLEAAGPCSQRILGPSSAHQLAGASPTVCWALGPPASKLLQPQTSLTHHRGNTSPAACHGRPQSTCQHQTWAWGKGAILPTSRPTQTL